MVSLSALFAARAALRPGQVVRHRSEGYRGVVVHADDRCTATDPWYAARHRRPRRDQRWVHVLVDRSAATAYVAAEELELEVLPTPVAHPLVHMYFKTFGGDGYTRNDRSWPCW